MRIAFLIIVFLHGVIHSLGFVKAFGFSEVKGLSLPISKPQGLLWLSAMLLCLLYGVTQLANMRYAWLLGLSAAVISQILVVIFWKDARIGTIPNLIIILASVIQLGSFLLESEFINHVKADFGGNNTLSTEILTEKDIAHLPEPVQRYLIYTKSVGQPKVRNFRAEFVGGMRGKPEEPYMKFKSVQYNFYQMPSRHFFMRASKMGLPATGLHTYQNEKATFQVKMLNWLKVVDASGDKLNQAETVTLFNDMCFIAPPTLIDRRITWEAINDTSARGIFKNGDVSISAVLHFNMKGELVNFISNDRYETDGRVYSNHPWATPVESYQEINGYLLPSKAKLIYQKPEGDFTYGELEYKSVKYNLTGMEAP